MTRKEILNVAEAKARFAEMVNRAADGEEIVIARNGVPQARLVPLSPSAPRIPGRGAGKWKVAEDFDDPLPPELQTWFEEGSS